MAVSIKDFGSYHRQVVSMEDATSFGPQGEF